MVRKLALTLILAALLLPATAIARSAPTLEQARVVVHNYSRFARIIRMRRLGSSVIVDVRERWRVHSEGEAPYSTESSSRLRVFWRSGRLLIDNLSEGFSVN